MGTPQENSSSTSNSSQDSSTSSEGQLQIVADSPMAIDEKDEPREGTTTKKKVESKSSTNDVPMTPVTSIKPSSGSSLKIRNEPQVSQMTIREAAVLLASLSQSEIDDTPTLFKNTKKMNIKLPVNSIEELEALERDIENEATRLKLLSRLGTIGGKNSGQCIRNTLRVLLSDAVATKLNWAGRGGKKPFQNSEIKNVLFDAVRMNFPKVTDYELKDPVQCWLKRSRIHIELKKTK